MKRHSESQQKSRLLSFKKAIVYGLLSFLVVGLIGFVSVCFSIRSAVKDMSAEAVKEFPGDRVQALIAYVGSENHTLKEGIAQSGHSARLETAVHCRCWKVSTQAPNVTTISTSASVS